MSLDTLDNVGEHPAKIAVADLEGALAHAPLRPKIFSISWFFLENLTKLYVGAPPQTVSSLSYGESWIRPLIGTFINVYIVVAAR